MVHNHKHSVVGEPETEWVGLPDLPGNGYVPGGLVEPVALLEKIFGHRHMVVGVAGIELGFQRLPVVPDLLGVDERHEFGSHGLLTGKGAMGSTFQGDRDIALPPASVVVPVLRKESRSHCEIRILLTWATERHG